MTGWTPEIPPPEHVAAAFLRDVFVGALDALDEALWIDLPEPKQDIFLERGGGAEEQLEEIVYIWDRLGDARIQLIEGLRERDEAAARLDLGRYTLGTGEYPELEEPWSRAREAEVGVSLYYKSLFVFGDILTGDYVRLSEPVWQAPEGIDHSRGLSSFLASVKRAREMGPLPSPFDEYMDALNHPMQRADQLLGFYRDKFITHLPSDIVTAGGGGSLSSPLDFSITHSRRRGAVNEAEFRRLRAAVRQVEAAEGLNVGSDEPDPRQKLQRLGGLMGSFTKPASTQTIQNLLKEWGITSPPALTVASTLNDLLELWAKTLTAKVGLVDPSS